VKEAKKETVKSTRSFETTEKFLLKDKGQMEMKE